MFETFLRFKFQDLFAVLSKFFIHFSLCGQYTKHKFKKKVRSVLWKKSDLLKSELKMLQFESVIRFLFPQ